MDSDDMRRNPSGVEGGEGEGEGGGAGAGIYANRRSGFLDAPLHLYKRARPV